TVRFWRPGPGDAATLTIDLGLVPEREIHQVAFTREGRYLATANANGTVAILRVPPPPVAHAPDSPRKLPDPVKLAEEPSPLDALKAIDSTKDFPQRVAVLGDGPFRLPEGPVSWMAHSADGKLLAVPCGGMVVLFDAATGRRLRTLSGHSGRVYNVAFS